MVFRPSSGICCFGTYGVMHTAVEFAAGRAGQLEIRSPAVLSTRSCFLALVHILLHRQFNAHRIAYRQPLCLDAVPVNNFRLAMILILTLDLAHGLISCSFFGGSMVTNVLQVEVDGWGSWLCSVLSTLLLVAIWNLLQSLKVLAFGILNECLDLLSEEAADDESAAGWEFLIYSCDPVSLTSTFPLPPLMNSGSWLWVFVKF
ncbi:hypothetical protein Nepgr_020402 [Nepenthes gracilis]|uniref:Uncharacterized protein n=1 Tax=Nepenthes gracilis TaxID=150966 RepID=A0AAD3SYY5_NEPGR|nr:hypothetical protein Nepgr_020402 [Nepenthes gracilis]